MLLHYYEVPELQKFVCILFSMIMNAMDLAIPSWFMYDTVWYFSFLKKGFLTKGLEFCTLF